MDGKENVKTLLTTKLADRKKRLKIRTLPSLEEIPTSAQAPSPTLPARLFNQAMTVMVKTTTVLLSSTQQNMIMTWFTLPIATHTVTQTSANL